MDFLKCWMSLVLELTFISLTFCLPNESWNIQSVVPEDKPEVDVLLAGMVSS